MLVLTQGRGDSTTATINGVVITVTVVEILGDKVRLGWDAPKDVKILRQTAIKRDEQ